MTLHLSKFDPEQKPKLTPDNENVLEPIVPVDDFSPSVFALSMARGSAELIVDPVFLGWRQTLRTISYLKAVYKILKHRKHLILDSICEEQRTYSSDMKPR